MDRGFIRRLIVALYTIIMIFIVFLGFAYSNQETARFGENFIQFEKGWTLDGVELIFPFECKDTFEMENVLPQVYGD